MWKWWQILFSWAPKSLQMVTTTKKLRHLLLGRKAMINLDSTLKSRDITLQTKVYIVKAMGSPVVIYGCESWTIKKAELWRIDAFEPWCWRRLLRVPCTARRSNQSILKEISPEYSLGGLMWSWSSSTLATWCKKLTHWKRPWCWERLRAGGETGNKEWDGWMASLTQWTRLSEFWEILKDWRAWCAEVHGVTKSQTRLSDWTTITNWKCYQNKFAIFLSTFPAHRGMISFHDGINLTIAIAENIVLSFPLCTLQILRYSGTNDLFITRICFLFFLSTVTSWFQFPIIPPDLFK